jgi:hypothetical protein
MRLSTAIILAYLAAYAVEIVLGNWDPRRVGWSASYLPVFIEGAVFGFSMRGAWGAVLAPLPILIVPETWIRLQHLVSLIGPVGLVLFVQPVPVMWLGGIIGAFARRFVRPPVPR